jgi:hypothetical protein
MRESLLRSCLVPNAVPAGTMRGRARCVGCAPSPNQGQRAVHIQRDLLPCGSLG